MVGCGRYTWPWVELVRQPHILVVLDHLCGSNHDAMTGLVIFNLIIIISQCPTTSSVSNEQCAQRDLAKIVQAYPLSARLRRKVGPRSSLALSPLVQSKVSLALWVSYGPRRCFDLMRMFAVRRRLGRAYLEWGFVERSGIAHYVIAAIPGCGSLGVSVGKVVYRDPCGEQEATSLTWLKATMEQVAGTAAGDTGFAVPVFHRLVYRLSSIA